MLFVLVITVVFVLISIYFFFRAEKLHKQLINQQIELSYNQAEVKATRYELRGQKEQLIEQNTLPQIHTTHTYVNVYGVLDRQNGR